VHLKCNINESKIILKLFFYNWILSNSFWKMRWHCTYLSFALRCFSFLVALFIVSHGSECILKAFCNNGKDETMHLKGSGVSFWFPNVLRHVCVQSYAPDHQFGHFLSITMTVMHTARVLTQSIGLTGSRLMQETTPGQATLSTETRSSVGSTSSA